MTVLGQAWTCLLDLVAPRDCPACGQDAGRSLCVACHRLLEPAPTRDLDGIPVVGAALFLAPLDGAVHRFKYQSRPDLAAPLAALFTRADLGRLGADPRSLFVPVPLHRTRLAERGYDQSALLAGALARARGRRTCARALWRTRMTQQQARLDARARWDNVIGAFEPNPKVSLAGLPVVLVDDVVTTGATARECAGVLGRAGAHVTAIACIALTPHGSSRNLAPPRDPSAPELMQQSENGKPLA